MNFIERGSEYANVFKQRALLPVLAIITLAGGGYAFVSVGGGEAQQPVDPRWPFGKFDTTSARVEPNAQLPKNRLAGGSGANCIHGNGTTAYRSGEVTEYTNSVCFDGVFFKATLHPHTGKPIVVPYFYRNGKFEVVPYAALTVPQKALHNSLLGR